MAEPYLEMLSQRINRLKLPTSDEVVLECKHFFGGAALYANERICASLTPAGFALKLPENTRNRLIEEGTGAPLRYFDKAPIKREYVALSQSIVDDPEALRLLLDMSIRYVVELGGAMSEKLVVVDTVAGRVEGEILLSYLRANDLECMLSQEGAASAYGISVGRMARVEILCPVTQEQAARELIAQYYDAQAVDKS